MSQTNENGARRPARKLTPEQRRRILERRRRERARKRAILIASGAAVLALAVALGFTLPAKRGADRSAASTQPPDAEVAMAGTTLELEGAADSDAPAGGDDASAGGAPAGDAAVGGASAGDAAVGGAQGGASAPEPAATQNPNQYQAPGGVFVFDDAYVAAARGEDTGPLLQTDFSQVDPAKLNRWPEVTEGYIPILYHANNVSDKIIAITVDDCFQPENLRKIVQCALDNGGRLTIFPIGKNLAKQNIGEAVKWAWESGMEIENHTYNHVGLLHYDDERMMQEMWMQSMVLNQVLGVNYQEHFFRPRGGDEREDQRVHAYANQMGMSAIAIWSEAFRSNEGNALTLNPGYIYLFHTTDNDTKRLLQFIPEAVAQGYRLVTLNELFGLPENATSALTAPADPPALAPFHIVIPTLHKTQYLRAAAVVQKRLVELGWLEGEADGVYGQSSFMATGYFQLAADLKADGKAGPNTQSVLFADDAPKATSENKAKVKALMNK